MEYTQMKTKPNQNLLMSMVKSLVENDTKLATDSLHKYLTNKTHKIVEMHEDGEEEMEFNVTVTGDPDELDHNGEEMTAEDGESLFCTGCGEESCVCEEEAPFCGDCGCKKEECACEDCCDGDSGEFDAELGFDGSDNDDEVRF